MHLYFTHYLEASHLRGEMQQKWKEKLFTHVPRALGALCAISNLRKRGRIFLKTSELRMAVFAQQFHSRQLWAIVLPQRWSRIIEIQSRGISMRYRKNRLCTFSGTKQCTCRS